MVGIKDRKLTATFKSSANLAQYVATHLRCFLEDKGAENVEIKLE